MPDFIESPFQFLNNKVSKLEIDNNVFDFSSKDIAREISSLDYQVGTIAEEEDRYLGVLTLSIKLKGSIGEKTAFELSISIDGAFEGKKGPLDEKQFTKMLELNGATALFSIARGIIISTSSMCGVTGQIRLPMVNMLDVYNQKHMEDKTE